MMFGSYSTGMRGAGRLTRIKRTPSSAASVSPSFGARRVCSSIMRRCTRSPVSAKRGSKLICVILSGKRIWLAM